MALLVFQARNGKILAFETVNGDFEKVTQCNFDQFQKGISASFILEGRRKKALERLQKLTAVPEQEKS